MAMNFILMPALKHRAFVKVLTNLWNQDDVWTSVAKLSLPFLNCVQSSNYSDFIFCSFTKVFLLIIENAEWVSVENLIIEKVSKLPLPELLKKELLNFVKPIGHEMLKWKVYHYYACHLPIGQFYELCWTSQGKVDEKKTAEALSKDDSLDITARYRLACIYCLESSIEALWNKIPDSCVRYFYSGKDPNKIKQHELVSYWTYVIKNEISALVYLYARFEGLPPYVHLFAKSVVRREKVAIGYFLQKLTSEEKEEWFLESLGHALNHHSRFDDFPFHSIADIICFVLSQMDEDLQKKVLRKVRPKYQLLKSFLCWTYEFFFIEIAQCVWDYLSEDDYIRLLQDIVSKEIKGYGNYDYQKLFADFWEQNSLKKRFNIDVSNRDFQKLILSLFGANDTGNIRLVLNNASLVEKENLLCSLPEIFYLRVERFMSEDSWNLLIFYIGECFSSKERIIKFTDKFKFFIAQYLYSNEVKFEEKKMWADRESMLDKLVDDFVKNYDKKRSLEDMDDGMRKRLCSAEINM